MSYIQQLLSPQERVLFQARFHPVLYLPGALMTVFAIGIMAYGPGLARGEKTLTGFARWLDKQLLNNGMLVTFINKTQEFLFGFLTPEFFLWSGLILLMWGVAKLLQAFLVIQFTELVITDQRIICKQGIYTTTTYELDRFRTAGVIVYQTIWGRMLNYGWVLVQGFSGNISGLPPMVRPQGMQQELARRDWAPVHSPVRVIADHDRLEDHGEIPLLIEHEP